MAAPGRNRKPPRVQPNWPLLAGVLIIALIGWAAVRGPDLAPLDPLARAGPIKVNGEYLRLPYPPGTPGHPLGTDNDGRDTLSRILWGIRPTLTMVLIVAAVRLVIGAFLGLAAGWSRGRFGRLCDGLIRIALAVPVIMVALGGISAVGVDLGIWAFVFGLSLTGWVETARIIRERTAAVRQQVYIEASHSLGAGDLQILVRHVLRQVLSLLWMLFAFEVSATLMLTAALGFLGYYIGGDVWVQVTDAVAEATSGTPELGQMLATTGTIVTRPWPLLMIGAVIFLIVLGFNLIGEGLRRRASLAVPRRRSRLGELAADASLWLEDRLIWPVLRAVESPLFRISAGGALALLLVWAGLTAFRARSTDLDDAAQPAFSGPLWGSSLGDPAGSLHLPALGPAEGQIAWTFQDPAGFPGGPVVNEDGLVIAAGSSGVLYAFQPDGALRWQTRLPAEPAAAPALDASGRIFVADRNGGLAAFSPVGVLLWQANADLGRPATAAPVAAADGWIYYPTGPFLQAVSPSGEETWTAALGMPDAGRTPVRTAGGIGFLDRGAIDLSSGAALDWIPPGQVDQYMVRPDGSLFYRKDNDIFPLSAVDGVPEPGPALEWDHQSFSTGQPQVSGAAPGTLFWLFYSSFARDFGFGEDTRIVWLDASGEVLANSHYATRNSAPIGFDSAYTFFSCGNLDQGYGPMECQSFPFEAEEPGWTLAVNGFELAGGALAPQRLYVATTDGFLHAIGAAEAPILPTAVPEPTQTPHATGTAPAEAAPPAYTTSVEQVLYDPYGFAGGPVLLPDGRVAILNGQNLLYVLDPAGVLDWQLTLPENGAGTPAVFGDRLYVLDRAGVSVLDFNGGLVWRFEHAAGTAVAGPVIGPEGNVYYTLQTGSYGSIQAVDPEGAGRWIARVETFAFYRPPQVSPSGELVFFAGEAYNAADGSAVDLKLEFEPDRFVVGQDRQLYILFETTFVRWTYTGGQAVLAEERVFSPHELGTPLFAGVLENGEVWFLYVGGLAWFTPDGVLIHLAQVEDGFFSHFFGVDSSGLEIACGRNRRDFRQNALANCVAFSREYPWAVWDVPLGEYLQEFTGGVLLPGKLIVALEDGFLFAITYSNQEIP